MPQRDWNDAMSVGIEEIDQQHRQIIQYINEVDMAIKTAQPDRIAPVLTKLAEYAASHFTLEEEIMAQANYPALKEHRKVHEAYAQKIRHFQERHKAGQDIGRDLRSDLIIWLTDHIQRDDQDYAQLVRKNLKGQPGWFSKTLSRLFKRATP